MKSLVFILLMVFLGPWVTSQGLDELVYMTEDYPPSNFLVDGVLKGVSVDLLKEVWKVSGTEPQEIRVYPWARSYDMVLRRPNHVLFAMTRSPARESSFKWAGPISRGVYSLVGLQGKSYDIKSLQDVRPLVVGVLREDLGQKIMENAGHPAERLQKVSRVEQLTAMLELGRIDLICIYKDTLTEYETRNQISPVKYVNLFTVSESVLYYAFNLETPDTLVAEFQAALTKVEGRRREIVRSYGGTP